MKKERDFIVEKLQEAGVHGKIHDSLKSLKIATKSMWGRYFDQESGFLVPSQKKYMKTKQGKGLREKSYLNGLRFSMW